MKLNFEYGHGLMEAELPENTDVFIPGETIPDPPCLPQDMDSLMNITRESVQNPIGMLPISKLVHKGRQNNHCHSGHCKGRLSANIAIEK